MRACVEGVCARLPSSYKTQPHPSLHASRDIDAAGTLAMVQALSLTGRAGGADARCGVKAEEGESIHGGGWASRPNSWGKQKKD